MNILPANAKFRSLIWMLRRKKTNKKQVKDSLSSSPFLRVRFSQTPFLSPSYFLHPLIWLSVCGSWSLSCALFGLLLLSMCPMVSAMMPPTASPRMQPWQFPLLSTRDLGCSGGCLGCLQTLPYVTTGVGAADPKTQAGRYVESLCSTSFLSFLGMCRILLMRILKCTETHWFPVSWTAGAVCSFGGLINNYAVLQSHTDGMVTWVVFWVSCVLYAFVHRMPKISAVF